LASQLPAPTAAPSRARIETAVRPHPMRHRPGATPQVMEPPTIPARFSRLVGFWLLHTNVEQALPDLPAPPAGDLTGRPYTDTVGGRSARFPRRATASSADGPVGPHRRPGGS
jgi:hypothetical protein